MTGRKRYPGGHSLLPLNKNDGRHKEEIQIKQGIDKNSCTVKWRTWGEGQLRVTDKGELKSTPTYCRFYIDGTAFIDFCEKFKYLGSMLHYSLTSDENVDKRITSATAAFGALKNIFADKYLSEELKGEVYKALILPTLLYGCEAWPRRTYAHEPGATAVTDWLGIAFSTDWLSTDDLGQDVGERAQK